jgi:hypothetical protein
MSMTEVGDVLRLKDKRSIDYQGSEHMIRYGVAFFMLAGSALMAMDPAYSQVVQYQFSPPPPVVPAPSSATPSYSQGFGVAPPVATPGPSTDPYLFPQSPSFVQVPGRAPVIVPPLLSGPGSSYGITNCLQAGTAAGLGANELGGFTNQCLN